MLPMPLQACYGHTEGTAGITGALLATAALQRACAPGITNLREARPCIFHQTLLWRSLNYWMHQQRLPEPGREDRERMGSACFGRAQNCGAECPAPCATPTCCLPMTRHCPWQAAQLGFRLVAELSAPAPAPAPLCRQAAWFYCTSIAMQRVPMTFLFAAFLRQVNPYVAAAVEDWRSKQGIAAMLPRQSGPSAGASSVTLCCNNLSLVYHVVHREQTAGKDGRACCLACLPDACLMSDLTVFLVLNDIMCRDHLKAFRPTSCRFLIQSCFFCSNT